MPSPNGRIALFEESPNYLIEISGLVARSHGVTIRECLDILIEKDKTAHREYRHIHPAFLMALVRLADYLDLDQGRAPSSVLSAKSLRSPISKREWWAHKALVDCHSYTEDPECLHVVIDTSLLPDIETYTTIEDKVQGVQQELDSCWAVLGEVYGRYPPLNRLALKIRRIRSDLRQPSIVNKLPFVPHKASLESSKSDLLKLLIAPLYGDIPAIGVRELLQNSIDAVRELKYTLSKSKDLIPFEQDVLQGNVLINFEKDEDDNFWIVVDDQGIGMTWETVKKYYLTAGASFRQSNVWKKKFLDDDSNLSQVLRSGRFGVGILAAFLLGDRVQVTTRYIEEPRERGIFFEFGLDDTTIELRWEKRNVGTTVKVKVTENVLDELQSDSLYNNGWDWYCLKKPKVIRYDREGIILKQKFNLPDITEKLPPDQHEIAISGYKAIRWTYNKTYPALICNGIYVSDYKGIKISAEFEKKSDNKEASALIFDNPNISVFDPDGLLPLNLSRDSIAKTPKNISSALAKDICRNFIAYCLCKGPSKPLLHGGRLNLYSLNGYNGYSRYGYYGSEKSYWLLDCKQGFTLCDYWHLNKISPRRGLVIRGQDDVSRLNKSSSNIFSKYDILLGGVAGSKLGNFDNWHRNIITKDLQPLQKNIITESSRTIMPRKWFDRLMSNQPQYICRKINKEEEYKDWVIWSNGFPQNSNTNLRSIADEFFQNNVYFQSITECFLIPAENKPPVSIVSKIWKQDVGSPFIPFEERAKEEIIENLGKEYERHISQWKIKK